MSSLGSKTISLTLSEELLARTDQQARSEYATRSDIIRQALVAYIQQHQPVMPKELAPPEPEKPRPDLEKLMKKYPHLDPLDTALVQFLDDYENNRL